MKTMSNVDIYAICTELKDTLKDARVDKAYQPTKDTVLIRFHIPSKGRTDVVFQAGTRVHTTQYPPENPKIPPSFPMLLRKHLKGGTITDVRQHHFDRIMELDIQKEHSYTLVVELFSKGNIILLDEEGTIILPLKRKLWQDRKISSKEMYKYPPENEFNPLKAEKEDIKKLFMDSDRDVVRTLAGSGLGGLYAEEIVLRSNVDKKKPATDLEESEIEAIYNAFQELFQPLKDHEFHPRIISGEKEDVLPLELRKYEGFEAKTFETYNRAADEFYSSRVGEDIKKVHEDIWAREIGKYEKRMKIQLETLENFKKTIIESTIKGDALYAHYQEVQDMINTIMEARKNYSWAEVSSTIKKAKKHGAAGLESIEAVDKMGVMDLNLDGVRVQVDSNIGIPENAEKYYNKGKKAKRKINGVNIAIEKTQAEIDKAKNKREIAMEKVLVPQKRVRKELKWFEKLRWFVSSDGNLVIGGRDATTNEMVVKKHLENRDVYFHSDIHGAASVVVKAGEGEISEETLIEAASFSASFSSAWQKGFSTHDVYWVHPDQVSKTPQSGEFVAKGAFIIRGSRNYMRGVPLLVAVGIVDYEGERVMAGPPEAVSAYTDNYVVIKPGYTKKEEMARQIRNKIDTEGVLSIEDVVRVLPSGKCDFVDKRSLKWRR
jgi:predicted ribosome quality control (RQC) complex YloA/Tae2 family protein